ncbi:MAG: phosphoethanolamine--lipid A transferase [Gemmobacter sp.]|nr:phosphoethanolamine--lipid A transferase [Gemmobacter sp.]
MTTTLPWLSGLRRRPVITPLVLNLAVATWIMAVSNAGFWSAAARLFAGSTGNLIGIGAAVWAVTFFTLSVISLPWLHRPLAAVLLIISAAASWYQQSLGALIDREMVRNIMMTTVTESHHLITPDFVLAVTLKGVLPALVIFWPRLVRRPLVGLLWRWPLGVATGFALTVGFLATDFKAYSAVLRENKEMMGAYQPGASIAAVFKYAKEQLRDSRITVQPLGRDAQKGPLLAAAGKPALLILFVGETVRAQNFGLNGYSRDTTPELRARNVINFPDTTACGTSTAVSVPCMFSPFTTADYTRRKAIGSENLLDVLSHAGVKVEWWDNNTGDQTVAKRIGWNRIDATLDPAACAAGECTDDALLPVIDRTIRDMTQDTVLVLHMIGSHGPAYFLRYPEEQAEFTPDCRTAQFSACTTDEIVNAYDDTILETDRVIAATIDRLDAAQGILPAILFLSDHGESLGEGGLYLHAAPRFMAPEVQTKVPFVMWLSDRFAGAMAIDTACLRTNAARPVSHDNLFHTVLGMLDIQTTVREPELDLAGACRNGEAG